MSPTHEMHFPVGFQECKHTTTSTDSGMRFVQKKHKECNQKGACPLFSAWGRELQGGKCKVQRMTTEGRGQLLRLRR